MWTLYPALQLAAKDRAGHAREAARLREAAATITIPAVRAQVLTKAREHERLAVLAERDGHHPVKS
jgi:hypothetical protein